MLVCSSLDLSLAAHVRARPCAVVCLLEMCGELNSASVSSRLCIRTNWRVGERRQSEGPVVPLPFEAHGRFYSLQTLDQQQHHQQAFPYLFDRCCSARRPSCHCQLSKAAGQRMEPGRLKSGRRPQAAVANYPGAKCWNRSPLPVQLYDSVAKRVVASPGTSLRWRLSVQRFDGRSAPLERRKPFSMARLAPTDDDLSKCLLGST